MLNNVNLCGRLTADPELRYTSTTTQIAVTTFTLAVERDYSGANGEKVTDFINCVAWRNTAEFISKYFKKGKLMIAKGSIQTRNWTDNEGKKRYATEVNVDNVYFAGDKSETNVTPKNEPTSTEDFVPLEEIDADLPF